MSSTQAAPVAPRITLPSDDPAASDRAPAASRSPGSRAVSLEGPSVGVAALLPWFTEGVGATAPTPWLVAPAASGKGSGAGYAGALVAGAAPSGVKATGDWAFLSDPSLSVEEKLSRFMIAVQKKLGDQLTEKMNDYKAKYGEGGTETKEKQGGGFLGSILGAIFPSGGIFDKLIGGLEDLLGGALKSMGGPLLAALATAVGLPVLAPAALKFGESLGGALAGVLTGDKAKATPAKTTTTPGTTSKPTTTSTPKTTPKTTTPAKKGEAGSPDERLEMLEIQRLVEKQNQMFTLVSNLLKSMHDTTMVAIQNVR
jgi:hypothetical protein